jgi:hypothetical protein
VVRLRVSLQCATTETVFTVPGQGSRALVVIKQFCLPTHAADASAAKPASLHAALGA